MFAGGMRHLGGYALNISGEWISMYIGNLLRGAFDTRQTIVGCRNMSLGFRAACMNTYLVLLSVLGLLFPVKVGYFPMNEKAALPVERDGPAIFQCWNVSGRESLGGMMKRKGS